MFHNFVSDLTTFVPLLIVALILLLPRQLTGSKSLDKSMEETRLRSDRWHQQSTEFNEQLLAEFRRHNAVMEQQSQLLARLLERLEQ